jgi:hypothetical protein
MFKKAHRLPVRFAVVAVLLAAAVSTISVQTSEPAHASFGISQRMGWDACGIGSTANASAFWTGTPYWNMGLYLGGSSYGTGCTRWSNANVSTLQSQGWKFLPLWVGPQAPCTGFPSRFSSNPTTAYNQGKTEAISAYQKIVSLGWSTLDAPIIYDLEGFDTGNASCVAAVKQFISGWMYQLHLPPAQKGGVYGSTCSSNLSGLAGIANVPDFIAGANWSDNKNTATLACIPTNYWTQNQRHKQYVGDHNETWNGVTLNVDNDCSNAPVYPSPDQLSVGQGCV